MTCFIDRNRMNKREERCPYLRPNNRCNIAKSAVCAKMKDCEIKKRIHRGKDSKHNLWF